MIFYTKHNEMRKISKKLITIRAVVFTMNFRIFLCWREELMIFINTIFHLIHLCSSIV